MLPRATRSSTHDCSTSSTLRGNNPKPANRLTLNRNTVHPGWGGVTKRFDAEKVNTTTPGAAVAITGGVLFRHSDGTDYTIGGTNDGRVIQFNSNGTTTT